jgi:hypothetical protein
LITSIAGKNEFEEGFYLDKNYNVDAIKKKAAINDVPAEASL